MALLLSISLVFTFLGGQIAIMVTDFLQGTFCNIVFALVIIFLLITFSWNQITEAMLMAPEGKSVVNPFDLGKEENFNIWYYMIAIVIMFYGAMGWQGTAGYNCAAKNAHESKMAGILNGWRFRVLVLIMLILPICVRTFLTHPDFADQAVAVHAGLEHYESEELQSQARTPLAIAAFFPAGLMGLMCAAMLAAFISTHDTYLHSWGTMFIQDVILPFRKKPFTPGQHLWLLRCAIFGVAVFIFGFSLIFEHTQRVSQYCAITASVFIGGAGTVIIGGLYWSKGTTPAAWTAIISGLSLSLVGILITQGGSDYFNSMQEIPFWMEVDGFLGWFGLSSVFWAVAEVLFSLTGQEMSFWVIVISITLYIVVSLAGPRKRFNMDRLLHRGKYAVKGEASLSFKDAETLAQKLGFTKEFTTTDKVVAGVTLAWPLVWFVVFLIGNVYHLTYGISDASWAKFWYWWVWITLATFIALIAWFTIGGVIDLKYLFNRLRIYKPDSNDDGRVLEKYDD
jgi:SSS family solute:Na+ symporter